MKACKMALLALVFACSGKPTADVSWLINENTEEVMGLVGRGAAAGSTRAHRFVLLECASYDMFAAASEEYQRRAVEANKDEQPPRGCKELVTTELSREQLKASKKDIAAKLKKEKSITGLLDNLSDGLNSGAVFSVLGISGKHSKLIMRVVEKLKSSNILPHIPAQGKIKKGLVVLSTVAMLVTSSGLLKRKEHEHYQTVLDELSGAEYMHRLQDQEASQQSYEEIKQLLTTLVEEKGSKKVDSTNKKKSASTSTNERGKVTGKRNASPNKLPRVVAN